MVRAKWQGPIMDMSELANGKVHIYRGTVPVLKNVPEKDAVQKLLKVIEKDKAE